MSRIILCKLHLSSLQYHHHPDFLLHPPPPHWKIQPSCRPLFQAVTAAEEGATPPPQVPRTLFSFLTWPDLSPLVLWPHQCRAEFSEDCLQTGTWHHLTQTWTKIWHCPFWLFPKFWQTWQISHKSSVSHVDHLTVPQPTNNEFFLTDQIWFWGTHYSCLVTVETYLSCNSNNMSLKNVCYTTGGASVDFHLTNIQTLDSDSCRFGWKWLFSPSNPVPLFHHYLTWCQHV